MTHFIAQTPWFSIFEKTNPWKIELGSNFNFFVIWEDEKVESLSLMKVSE